MDVTIVIPVFNQLHYTRQCLDSLNAAGCADGMIVVVNNASTDGTAEFLARRPGLRVIQNSENRACAAAWNQGFLASRTEWTLFLNNDVVVPPGWLENLAAFAEKETADIASPAMGEGQLDYALADYARKFTAKMKTVQRRNTANGACFLVRRRVFEAIGNFDESFCRGGNEDDDFFCARGWPGSSSPRPAAHTSTISAMSRNRPCGKPSAFRAKKPSVISARNGKSTGCNGAGRDSSENSSACGASGVNCHATGTRSGNAGATGKSCITGDGL
jgi:glycosyltransferase involved in cell wall biosynthesis